MFSRFFIILLFLVVDCFSSFTKESDFTLKIFRPGKGKITFNTEFSYIFLPEGLNPSIQAGTFVERNSGAFTAEQYPQRLPPLFEHDRSVLETWDTKYFTDLTQYDIGDTVENWSLHVHGLELSDSKGIRLKSNQYFDNFISRRIKDDVPKGYEFALYYPYFFFNKVVISGSMVCQNFTPTFGHIGFVMDVPPENIVANSLVDMHTPTDDDFYHEDDLFEVSNIGINGLLRLQREKLLPKEKFIPSERIKPTTPSRGGLFSWYNELAYVPRTHSGETLSISGVFVRSSEEKLSNILFDTEIGKRMHCIAILFDLPIAHINDDNWYSSDI